MEPTGNILKNKYLRILFNVLLYKEIINVHT